MRKLVWSAAVLLVAVMGAGCGSSDDGSTSSNASGSTTTQPAQVNLRNDGQLTVGAEFPVAGFVELPISNPKGFEVDFATALARQMGIPKVKWVNTPFSGLFSPAPKKFDAAINEITITPDRAKVVDFSDPYFEANQGFLIHKGGPADGVKTIAAMKGLQFGCQATTTGCDYIKSSIKPSKQVRQYTTLGAATRALANGQIDAFLMDVAIGVNIVKQLPDNVAMTGQFKTGEQYGVLFQKGNPLRQQVNAAIAKLKANGELKKMQNQWFPGTTNLPVLQ